jgi:lipopolysaccharide export system permease protein
MAYNTEIVAILSSGISINRLMVPYLISATLIAAFSFFFSNYVIPDANKVRLDFEEKYIHKQPVNYNRINIHRQIEPGVFVYMNSYSTMNQTGYDFSLEKFVDNKLVYKLMGSRIRYDTTANKWSISTYYEREIDGLKETIREGTVKDTTLNMSPGDFSRRLNVVESMSLKDLKEFIRISRMQGETNLTAYQIERYKRTSFPFSTFILTIIGISVSYRKVRGGIGVQLGTGLVISFSYILFMQFSAQFSIGGSLPPLLSVWLPNLIYTIVGIVMYRFISQ